MTEPLINTTIDRSRHKVLVVDDNPTTRYATAQVLRAAGFMTQEAASGSEALDLASQHMSAVVLDVHLPDIDGFEVCRKLRAQDVTQTLPIMHLSAAFVRNEDKVTGLDAGADAYLVHPVEPAVLVATLQALIRARMAEDRLRNSETRFRALYEQVPTAMVLLDGEGRLADVNPAMCRALGHAPAALVGRPLSAFAPAEWTDFVDAQVRGVESGGSSQVEFPLVRDDGRWVRFDWTLSDEIEPGLRFGIALDVSERFELEGRRREVLEREQAARTAAERLSRTKDDFIAVLSHELRNPLNAIGGWVHLLKSPGRTAEQMDKGLAAIDRSVKAQARLISDILDVSRINSGKLRLHREWVEPDALITSSIEALSTAASAKRLRITLNQSVQEQPAWLDGTRFQQIVWNLLSNAIKFSFEDGCIAIDLSRDGDRLLLSVQDAGRGIRADFIGQMFERFSQSDSPDNRRHDGMGLGLSIVKNLAQLHGGDAIAESDGEGRGATFKVSLNVDPAGNLPMVLPDIATPSGGDAAAVAEPGALEGLDILLVEDNVDAAEVLGVILSDVGAHVRHAADFDQALAQIAERWPDILVSDIGLPGRDGYELIRDLRRLEAEQGRARTPAIAHTAFTRAMDHGKAADAGFDALVAKPLQPPTLLGVLNGLLS